MTQRLVIHQDNPQKRLVTQAAEVVRQGGVIVYPTDSTYAFGCHVGDKAALDRIRAIRHLDEGHLFTLICRDLSELATYAQVNNTHYRLIKASTPAPYTFLLKATREVPRRLQHPKRKTVGLRVPDNAITLALLESLGEPLMSSTCLMPGDELPMQDPDLIYERLHKQVDLIIDGGFGGVEETTVIDMVGEVPTVVRTGLAAVQPFAV